MVVVMQEGAKEEQIQHVIDRLVSMGFDIHRSTGASQTVLGAVGVPADFDPRDVEVLDGVREVVRITQPYKLASRAFRSQGTIVELPHGVRIGGPEIVVAAGPCSVETPEQIGMIADRVAKTGAKILRGGAFKPRSSPYSFQGLGEEGLRMLRDAASAENLKLVTEVMDLSQIEVIDKYADILQVGARNMQNFALLKSLGGCGRPVLLKRGMSSTIKELLMSAEYIVAHGNADVMLCERGIRTFETATRNTLDLNAIPYIKQKTHLPILVDPSHGTGIRDLVIPMSLAAAACGADGLLVEVHENPAAALSDGAQSLYPEGFRNLMGALAPVVQAVGRTLA